MSHKIRVHKDDGRWQVTIKHYRTCPEVKLHGA